MKEIPRSGCWKRILLGLGVLVVLAVGGMTYMIGGPRNLIGMLRYDQRQGRHAQGRRPRAGRHARGARREDARCASRSELGGKPTVLVFGSFT